MNLNDKWHIQDAVIQYAIYWNIPYALSALCESERKKMVVRE